MGPSSWTPYWSMLPLGRGAFSMPLVRPRALFWNELAFSGAPQELEGRTVVLGAAGFQNDVHHAAARAGRRRRRQELVWMANSCTASTTGT
jgi:hypothetical protein